MNRPSYTQATNYLGHKQYFNVELTPVCIECESKYVNKGDGVICEACTTEETLETSTDN